MANCRTAAILACAGSGSRMGGCCANKLLIHDGDIPVVAYTLKAFADTDGIDLIVVATKKELIPIFREMKEQYRIKKMVIVQGGSTRMESVLLAARAVPEEYGYLAIGDGARPLIRPQEIRATLEAAWKYGAAALGVHLTDTIKEMDGNQINRTIPRDHLVGIQTPQVFPREEYLALAERALQSGGTFTDDASIYEYYGKDVYFVEGRRDNIKITLPEDVSLFRALMEARRCE